MVRHHEARDDDAQPSNALEGQQSSVEESAQVILLGDAQQSHQMRRKEDEVPKADAKDHPFSYTGRLHMANLLVMLMLPCTDYTCCWQYYCIQSDLLVRLHATW